MIRNPLFRRLHAGLSRARQVALFGLVLSLFAVGTAQGALTLIPAGLNPGDHFRVVFVSSATRNATSSNIADYDTFITNLAVAAGIDTYFLNPITWQAIGSTPTVFASQPSRLPTTSPAIYRIDGALVATSGADLWNSTIPNANPINLTESGSPISGETRVWTGTNNTGAGTGINSLGAGSPQATFGLATNTDSSWVIAAGGVDRTLGLRIYGYSSVLTVPAGSSGTVPEPSSLVIMASLGVLGLVGRRWRRAFRA